MRFASLQGSGNGAKYAAAGKAVADSSARVFDVQRKTGPDYAGISKTAMQTASQEKIAGMRAQASVVKAGIASVGAVKRVQIGIEGDRGVRNARSSSRKAGGLAAIGKIAAAGFLSASDNTKDRKYPTADRKGFDDAYQADVKELLANNKKTRESIYAENDATSKALRNKFQPSSEASPTDNPDPATVSPVSEAKPGKVDVGAVSVAPAMSTYKLSGNRKTVADAVAGPESGDWGYEAFNQGGGAGGTSVLGKSGSHKEVFGRSLTDHTLGEIYHRQNTKQRGLSLDEHMRTGGLHAVGRYQFIGSTLQDEARRMGLSPDTKFTPEVQDNIFFSHIKRVGNISPWVGPSTKWDQNKKNQINSLIPTL